MLDFYTNRQYLNVDLTRAFEDNMVVRCPISYSVRLGMKALYVLIALLLAGLLIESGPVLAQTRKAAAPVAKKSVPAPTKKKTVGRRVTKRLPPFDPTIGDNVDGDDLVIRRAAVAALGNMNGSVVVADPTNGRILTVVNQKLAYAGGFIPCSTIKLVTSVAALNEGIVSRATPIFTSRRVSLNMTEALAHSNNPYFSILGNRLGFEKVTYYAQMLGLGERAGLEIAGEQPGALPTEPPKGGGVGLATSFGSGFLVTPLELTALLSAIANGGTLYYLQYPRSQDEIDQFTPKVKRTLEIDSTLLSEMKYGLRGAVDYGTARRANYDPAEPILGKTGTCTDFRFSSHMGWFGSFNDVGNHQLAIVVMLTAGNKTVSGPVAAGVAGSVYKQLSEQRYFADASPAVLKPHLPEILTSFPCCSK
jgi:penicillin-binding protein 2